MDEMENKISEFKTDLEKFSKVNDEISLYAIAKCIGVKSIPIFELRQIIDDFLFRHPDFYFVLEPEGTRKGFIKLLGDGYLKRKVPLKKEINCTEK